MSQLHGILATTQLPASVETTLSNGSGFRFSLIPTPAALDCSCSSSCAIHALPVAYANVKLSGVPLVTPAPQSPAAEPALAQVVVPFGATLQPLLGSSDCALDGRWGNVPPFWPCRDSHGAAG